MSVLQTLTEGIVNRDMQKEGAALLSKWEKTGLLEGMGDDSKKNGMARLLENQAKELLREAASTMAGGDVEGFAAVAFPIVRRVFGGLIANDLVSVQPMSLPSGLIFFLDFTTSTVGSNPSGDRLGYNASESLYGGQRVGSQITGGVDLTTADGPEAGPYALNNGYSSPTGSLTALADAPTPTVVAANVFGSSEAFDSLCDYDPDFVSGTTNVVVISMAKAILSGVNSDDYITVQLSSSLFGYGNGVLSGTTPAGIQANGLDLGARLVRRLTRLSGSSTDTLLLTFIGTGSNGQSLDGSSAARANSLSGAILNAFADATSNTNTLSWARVDTFEGAGAVGSVRGAAEWALENNPNIPEINIKVDSIAVTAITKKLKAKWTPELGQDLNAYHNLDAEVELTSILSEQIALEIDQEILNDLIRGATAGTLYWSRSPGLFVDIETGSEIGASSAAPDFTGTVSEWYETLLERVNDVSARIHRKTLRGGANFLVCGPEVANILEFTAGFRASVTVDGDRGDAGAVKVGQLSKKLDVYVDPYFPRNVLLVGRRGGSFLESGYVYAPYVPLQVTPTIFGVEDFVPRKGVMTRYAKKMVRPDMYGLVICRDLLGGAGAVS
jgi:hypothetical protein